MQRWLPILTLVACSPKPVTPTAPPPDHTPPPIEAKVETKVEVKAAVPCPDLNVCRDEFVANGKAETVHAMAKSVTDDRAQRFEALAVLVEKQDATLGTSLDAGLDTDEVDAIAVMRADASMKANVDAFDKAAATYAKYIRATAISAIVEIDEASLHAIEEQSYTDYDDAVAGVSPMCAKNQKLPSRWCGYGYGTIGTGSYGTIGHGAGTGTGYGVGGGRGGMRGRTAPVPSVSIGQPNAQGDLDKAIIRRYIKRNQQKIQSCYEKELKTKPNLSGTVMVNFLITPNGNVSQSTASGVDATVSDCVAKVIKGIEFPKPKGGGNVQVNYPFIFRLSGG